MDKEELGRLVAEIEARAIVAAEAEYEGVADDGLQIARALLQVLGRRFGLRFVVDVQNEVMENADLWSKDQDPCRRADAVEIAAVARAGYFADLIEELVEREKPGNA